MCVIIAAPEGQKLDPSELLRASKYHQDGFGVAWKDDAGLVRYFKTMDFDVDKWRQPRGPVVVHFRLATAGARTAELCHPFPVSKSAGITRHGLAREVLFHNGHIYGWENDLYSQVPQRKRHNIAAWSDSRLAAWLTYRRGVEVLEHESRYGQRFVTLGPQGLMFYGSWSDEGAKDGIWRSNKQHLWSGASSTNYQHWGDVWSKWEYECQFDSPSTRGHIEVWCSKCNEVRCVTCFGFEDCLEHGDLTPLSEDGQQLLEARTTPTSNVVKPTFGKSTSKTIDLEDLQTAVQNALRSGIK